MKVLLIGSGGREHALAWKLSQSPKVSELVVTPGNAGMEPLARRVPLGPEPGDVIEVALREDPALVVVGPEAPLVGGVADTLSAKGLRVFGPAAAAARLEGSKAFAKAFMDRHGIPTALYQTFDSQAEALDHLRSRGAPVVVKDSALAAGKGVTVAATLEAAVEAVRRIFEAGRGQVVIEDLLLGQEVSYLVFTDGRSYRSLPLAQDYKQALDGDEGAMTGGMGAVAPVSLLAEAELRRVQEEIVERTLAGLREDGIDYRGVLYFGLMLTDDGPKLLEYNVRLGDPETQAVLPLFAGDLVEVMESVVEGRLEGTRLDWLEQASACIVLCAPGYPGEYRKGIELPSFEGGRDLLLFHAGTGLKGGRLVSTGGRVFNVVALGRTIEEAVGRAYEGLERARFPGAHYRRDIGARLRPG